MSTVTGTATGSSTGRAADTAGATAGGTATGTDLANGPGAGHDTDPARPAAPTDPTPLLSAGLRGALDSVRITADGKTAWVGDDEVTAESPSAMRFTLARALYEVLHTGRGYATARRPRPCARRSTRPGSPRRPRTRRPSRPPSSPTGARPPAGAWSRSTACA